LLPGTSYQWKVEVFQGAVSKMSEVRTFTTAAARPGSTYPGTSGRLLHLDASLGVLNGSGLPAANGKTVATWQDQSGLGNHVTQVTDANRPVYASNADFGRPALTFSRTPSLYLIPANASTFSVGTSEFDIIVLAKRTLNAGYTYVVGNRNAGNTNGIWYGWHANNGVYARCTDGTSNYNYAPDPAVPGASPAIG